MTIEKNPYSRIRKRGKDEQYIFSSELDLILGELKRVNAENVILRERIGLTETFFEAIIKLLARDGKVPSLDEFWKITGIDLQSLYRRYKNFPRYQKTAQSLGFKIRRGPRTKRKPTHQTRVHLTRNVHSGNHPS